MGAGAFRSPEVRCEKAIRNVRETFASTTRSKPRARALLYVLKLAIRPKHGAILYQKGTAQVCANILQEEPKGSPMREFALLTLLCLSLDGFVKRDMIETNKEKVLPIVIKVLRQERSGTSIKYASIALIHSLSRDDNNLEALFTSTDLLLGMLETAAYEEEGSPLRKLACEVICTFSEVKDYRLQVFSAYRDVAARVLISELYGSTSILDIVLDTLSNLAEHENNREAILKERIIVDCAIKVILVPPLLVDRTRAKTAALKLFHHLAITSSTMAQRVATLPRLVQAAVDCIESRGMAVSSTEIMALKLIHIFTIYPASRLAIFSIRQLTDTLTLQSKTNVYARMAIVNVTGAFDEDDRLNPHRLSLLGCEEMDDKMIDLLQCWIHQQPDSEEEEAAADREEEENYEFEKRSIHDITRRSSLLTLSVLLRRREHLTRLRDRVYPLVVKALELSLSQNDVRTGGFALDCLQSILEDSKTFQAEHILDLLGQVQQKVSPLWRPIRQDAENLVSRLSVSGQSGTRLEPVLDMLEKIVDDQPKRHLRPLEVPLTALTYSLDFVSKEERDATGARLIKLLPKAMNKAVVEDDSLSANYVMEIFQKLYKEEATTGTEEHDKERASVAKMLSEIYSSLSK